MSVGIGPATIGGWIPPVENVADFRILFGCMEEMMIFREALSAEEIQKLYRSSNPVGGKTAESSGKQNIGKGGDDDKHKP